VQRSGCLADTDSVNFSKKHFATKYLSAEKRESVKLWHCNGARSLRPLWALEEMGLEYELEILPFPPRLHRESFLDLNILGTVPYFEDGDVSMTESTAICQYLVDRYQRYDFGLKPEHPEYGAYLNWLHHADATLTFPQTIKMRYYVLEPSPEKQAVADDYSKWYIARLRRLNAHLETHEYLVDNRFTIADIAITFALYFGKTLGHHEFYKPQTLDYLERMSSREAFIKAAAMGESLMGKERNLN
jgi:glutathione S-transferase